MSQPLADLLWPYRSSILERYISDARQQVGPFYQALSPDELREALAPLVDTFIHSLAEGPELLDAFAERASRKRVEEGASLGEVQQMATSLRRALLSELNTVPKLDPSTCLAYNREIEELIDVGRMAITRTFVHYFNELRSSLIDREHVIQLQNRVIAELSTPVLPVSSQILVMPLIGAIDSQRAAQFMERMLTAISDFRARTIIVDITGVPIVDSAVANYIIQAARAAMLLGARCILVGVRPDVAQTMVGLGIDISAVLTCRDLEAGVAYALRLQGLAVQSLTPPAASLAQVEESQQTEESHD